MKIPSTGFRVSKMSTMAAAGAWRMEDLSLCPWVALPLASSRSPFPLSYKHTLSRLFATHQTRAPSLSCYVYYEVRAGDLSIFQK